MKILAVTLERCSGCSLFVDDKIVFSKDLSATVISLQSGQCVMNFETKGKELISCLREIGDMPLPPYIIKKRGPKKEDFKSYQTPFAKIDGSVAAPLLPNSLVSGAGWGVDCVFGFWAYPSAVAAVTVAAARIGKLGGGPNSANSASEKRS